MIQANLLLATKGRSPDSFIMLDLMRLPLGILSGIGFIGAGAILRRGDRVLGLKQANAEGFVVGVSVARGGAASACGRLAATAKGFGLSDRASAGIFLRLGAAADRSVQTPASSYSVLTS